jgi:hypothetical protein
MFGDYFRNLTTNQKIMFGVAVFLVVCVIVYLIYKYMFKAAKNFIQNFILTKRENFEKITIKIESKCNNNQFFNGSACSLLPDNLVRTNRVDGNAQILKFCLSNKGEFRNENFDCVKPSGGEIPVPALTQSKQNLNDSITVTNYGSKSSNAKVTSAIRINGTLSNTISINGVSPEPQDALRLYYNYDNANPTSNVVEFSGEFSNLATVSDKIYYKQTPPIVSEFGRVSGTFSYCIPIDRINFYPPANNIGSNSEQTDTSCFPPSYGSRGNSKCTTLSNEKYNNALTNNNDYINYMKENNIGHLTAVVSKILADNYINLYRLNPSDNTVTAINVNSSFTSSNTYSVIEKNGIYFLSIDGVTYNCGENNNTREVTPGDCSGNQAVNYYGYVDTDIGVNDSSKNMTRDKDIGSNRTIKGTFSNICLWKGSPLANYDTQKAAWKVVGGPGSCAAKDCTFKTTVIRLYNGFGKSFQFLPTGSTLFSSFIAGQDISLPQSLTLAGGANAPDTYTISTEWVLDVDQPPQLRGISCLDTGRITTAIKREYPNYNFNPLTDVVSWYYGQNTVRVTRKVSQRYNMDMSSWGVYYTTSNNSQPQLAGNSVSVFSSIFIGAPAISPAEGVPLALPIFQFDSVGSASFNQDTFDGQGVRTTQLVVNRNIWVTVNAYITEDNQRKLNPAITGLLRSFVNFSQAKTLANIENIFFTSDTQTRDVLKWGYPISSDPTVAVNINYNIFRFSILDVVGNIKSGQGTSSLTNGNSRSYVIDRNNKRIARLDGTIHNNTITIGQTPTTPTNTVPISFQQAINSTSGYGIFANTSDYLLASSGINLRDIYSFNGTSFTKLIVAPFNTSRRWTSIDVNNDGTRAIIVASDGTIAYTSTSGLGWSSLSYTLPSVTFNGVNIVSSKVSKEFTKVMFGNETSQNNGIQDVYVSTEYKIVRTIETITRLSASSVTYQKKTITETNTSVFETIDIADRTATASEIQTLGSDNVKIIETVENIGGYIYRILIDPSNNVTLSQISGFNNTGRYNISDFCVKRTSIANVQAPTILSVAEYGGQVLRWSISEPSSGPLIMPISYPSNSPFNFSGGKWLSIDMNDDIIVPGGLQIPAGQYQVICSNFESTQVSDLNVNDGRVLYSQDFGTTWREIILPTKYTGVQAPDVSPSGNSLSSTFYYNPYNLTSVLFANGTRDNILAAYSQYYQPVLENGRIKSSTSIDSTLQSQFKGLVRVNTTPNEPTPTLSRKLTLTNLVRTNISGVWGSTTSSSVNDNSYTNNYTPAFQNDLTATITYDTGVQNITGFRVRVRYNLAPGISSPKQITMRILTPNGIIILNKEYSVTSTTVITYDEQQILNVPLNTTRITLEFSSTSVTSLNDFRVSISEVEVFGY